MAQLHRDVAHGKGCALLGLRPREVDSCTESGRKRPQTPFPRGERCEHGSVSCLVLNRFSVKTVQHPLARGKAAVVK